MFPRMPGIKRVCFTQRITAFNETFAPIGTKRNLKSKGRPSYAVTRHEGITKRDADDIASSFIKWLLQPGIRDDQVITAWMGNCDAQGKHWILYTALVSFMLSDSTNVETFVLKCFGKGHTFMSEDLHHHSVESAMKKMKSIRFIRFCKRVKRKWSSNHPFTQRYNQFS